MKVKIEAGPPKWCMVFMMRLAWVLSIPLRRIFYAASSNIENYDNITHILGAYGHVSSQSVAQQIKMDLNCGSLAHWLQINLSKST
uniref:Putative secreted protein n=1 Tax=Anopheles marajoara TaxID=58244 RepID=A0A2M4CBN2_9DIPT